MTVKTPEKLTHEQFIVKAIEVLRVDNKPSKKDDTVSKGIHVVYSGFNAAFRSYFETEPQEATAALAKAGVIAVHPCRGGAMIYLKSDAPAETGALAKMGLA